MMNNLPEIYKRNVTWYFVGSILSKGVVFFLIPFYTNFLSTGEYGLLATFESMGRLFPLVFSLGLDSAFYRFYHREKLKGDTNISVLFSTYYIFIFFFGFSMFGILFFTSLMFDVSDKKTELSLFLVYFSSFFSQLSLLLMLIWRADVNAKVITLLNFLVSIGGFFLTVLLLFLDIGWLSRLISNFIITLIQTVSLFIFSIRMGWFCFKFKFNLIIEGLKFSLPLIPGIVSLWVVGFSDRLILTYFGMKDQAGILSLAAQISLSIYIIQDAISQVNTPVFLKNSEINIRNAIFQQSKFIVVLTFIISAAGICICAFARELIFLIAPVEYLNAYLLIIPYVIIQLCRGWYRSFAVILSYKKAVWVLSFAGILQSFLSIFLNFMLVPSYGMYGATFSGLISALLYLSWIVYWTQKIEPVSFDNSKVKAYLIAMFFILSSILFLDKNNSIGLLLCLKKLMLVVFSFFLLIKVFGYTTKKILRFVNYERGFGSS